MEEIIKTTLLFEIGYFDNGQFWSSASALTLEKAKAILETMPKGGINRDDGLPTQYKIVKKTCTYSYNVVE
jgi:hypothetical protein